MAALIDVVQKGSVDRSVTIRIIDSTDGTPETGVVFNTSGIDLWYRREGAAVTSITEATLAALTTAHTDGGFLHISHGEYRLDLPDAAFATGANHVDIGGTVTGMIVIGGRVRLVNYNPEDAVRLGLTALPNANADAAGGLIISDAGGLDADDLKADVTAILDDTGNAGVRVDWSAIQNPTATVALTGTTVDLIANAVDSTAVATGALTAAKFGAGAIDAAALAADAAAEIVAAVKAMVVESNGSVTLGQALSVILAFAAGVSTGQSGTSPVFKDPSGTSNRITGTTDGSGNRSVVTLSPSS